MCEGRQGIFSMGEERQSIKSMGKYASYSCKSTCSGLLFLLQRIYLPETQQGEESTTFFHHRLGRRQLCLAVLPHTNLAGPSRGFFSWYWQLLALCAGSGSAGGLGMGQSCEAGMLQGQGIKAFVSLELTSLRVHLPFPR